MSALVEVSQDRSRHRNCLTELELLLLYVCEVPLHVARLHFGTVYISYADTDQKETHVHVLLSYSRPTHSKFIVIDGSICTKIGESVKSLLILFFRDSQTSVSKIAAEIETCHRNVNYWWSSIGITGTVQNGQSSFELSRVDPNWQLWDPRYRPLCHHPHLTQSKKSIQWSVFETILPFSLA